MTHNPLAALGFSADASLSPDFMIHTQQWCGPPITHLQQFCVKRSHWDTASKCNFCSLQNQHCPINETSRCIIIEHRCILYGWNGSYSTEICYTRIIRARRMERLSDLTMWYIIFHFFARAAGCTQEPEEGRHGADGLKITELWKSNSKSLPSTSG